MNDSPLQKSRIVNHGSLHVLLVPNHCSLRDLILLWSCLFLLHLRSRACVELVELPSLRRLVIISGIYSCLCGLFHLPPGLHFLSMLNFLHRSHILGWIFLLYNNGLWLHFIKYLPFRGA